MTPLHLAFNLHKVEMAKILLEAGADQTTRNNVGANIVHSIFNDQFLKTDHLPRIRELLNMIDPRLISSMFTERTTEQPGAATPLARWIHANVRNAHNGNGVAAEREKFVELILEFSRGEDLNLVNGEGDTPVHAAVRYGADAVLRAMLECRPDLIFRENASGRTPFEVAEDAYLAAEVFADPPSISANNDGYYSYGRRRRTRMGITNNALLNRRPETFVEEAKDSRSGVEKVYSVCREFKDKALELGLNRKLVSLVEANEVAKRLALRKGAPRDIDEAEKRRREADGEEEIVGDEVAVWWFMGLNIDR